MASWTDYLPDWSSADALRLCDQWNAIEALTAAVNERSTTVGMETITLNRLYDVNVALATLKARIKVLIPLFVNHTAGTDGDFSGLDAIPMWNEDSITDALELEALTDLTRLYPIRDWIHEQYRIINMLRWLKSDLTILPGEARNIYRFNNPVSDPALWNTVTTAVNAAAWGYTEGGINSAIGHYGYHEERSYMQEATLTRRRGYCDLSSETDYDADIYAKFGMTYGAGGEIWYENNDYPTAQYLNYVRVITDAEISAVVRRIWFADFADSTLSDPNIAGHNYPYLGYTIFPESKMVKKFTGPNGFQFGDWQQND